jgi:hypothetical protein
VPHQPTPTMDTRGRNILHLIEHTIRSTNDDAERQAAEALLARVRATRIADDATVDDRATIPDLRPDFFDEG